MKPFMRTLIAGMACLLAMPAKVFAGSCAVQITISVNGLAEATITAQTDSSHNKTFTWIIAQDTLIQDSSSSVIKRLFTTNGNYTICLNVTDTVLACSIDTCFEITITNADYIPILDSVNEWWMIIPHCVVMEDVHMDSRNDCGNGPLTFYELNRFYTDGYDTIGNKIYHKLYAQANSPTTGISTPCHAGGIREDIAARKVYFITTSGTSEDLLYDFGMQINDTVSIACVNTAELGSNNNPFKLDSIRYTNIDGKQHRVFYLNRGNAIRFFWIEGIGSLFHPLYRYVAHHPVCLEYCHSTPLIQDFSNLPFLSCFYHKERVYFDTCAYQTAQGFNTCFAISNECSYGTICGSINDVHSLASIDLLPNPAREVVLVKIQLKTATFISLRVVDLQSRAVSTHTSFGMLGEGTHELSYPLPQLSSGIYLLQCETTEGSVFEKLVVE